jgi:ADP-heptose:LPS heptosyltransferase
MWELDLIISVDTAAAHLAGALGLPVWTLLPWAAEARWQRQSSHTILYGSMRLIRQPQHNDWYGLIQRLLAHLDVWLSDWSPAMSARNKFS